MTASRSDCSSDPADEIPAVADDGIREEDEEASSPKLREVLFERPNMLFCTVRTLPTLYQNSGSIMSTLHTRSKSLDSLTYFSTIHRGFRTDSNCNEYKLQ